MQHTKKTENAAPETGRQTKTEWQMFKLRRYRSQTGKVWNGKGESGPGASVELVMWRMWWEAAMCTGELSRLARWLRLAGWVGAGTMAKHWELDDFWFGCVCSRHGAKQEHGPGWEKSTADYYPTECAAVMLVYHVAVRQLSWHRPGYGMDSLSGAECIRDLIIHYRLLSVQQWCAEW